MTRIAFAAASLLVLSACGSEQSGTVVTEEGEVDYSVDASTGETTFTINSEDGDVEISGGSGLTGGFPDGYRQYPGSNVVTSSSVSHEEGNADRIMMNTSASVDDIVAFYRGQAEARGVEISTEFSSDVQHMIAGEAPDGEIFSLTVIEGTGVNTINLIITQGM